MALCQLDRAVELWKHVLPAQLSIASIASARHGLHPPPPAPSSYAQEYTLPTHDHKPLAQIHKHPLDVDLCFFEKPHIYTYKDVPTTISVTAVAHMYERPFVATEAIELMRKSRGQVWPRLEYVVGAERMRIPRVANVRVDGNANANANGTTHEFDDDDYGRGDFDYDDKENTLLPWTPSLGALLVDAGKTLGVVHPHSMAEGTDTVAVMRMLRASVIKGTTADPLDSDVYVFEREMSGQEIEAAWKYKGMVASHKGTEAHFQAELFFNGLPFRADEPEMDILLDFVGKFLVPKGLVAYNTEKEIVCVDADVAGSIDLVVYDARSDAYHIVDHKRSDKLKRDMRGYSKMKAPFDHLDDCKGAAYALQTSIYQFILEREYGMRIGDRVLLSLHPDAPFVTSVPYLKSEVEFLMQSRIELVRARQQVSREFDIVCALTGAPAVDAVRLADGRIAMEKAATVRGHVSFTPDVATRRKFDDLVRERTRPVLLGPCTSWRRLMPEQGIEPSFSSAGL